MKAHSTEGLNYVPKLAHTSPTSSRSCMHSVRFRSPSTSFLPKPLVYQHGNYEGDYSMFGCRGSAMKTSVSRRLQLIETDSDTDYKRVLDTYQPPAPPSSPPSPASQLQKNQLLRLCTQYRGQLLTPKRSEQLTVWREQLYANYYFQKSVEMLVFGSGLVVWLLRLLLYGLLRFGKWSYVLCKGRAMLRNTVRRLLWWMTLAKCGDVTHFAMLLLGTPLLFVVATLGFILSVYCEVKEWLSRTAYLLRTIEN